MEQHNRHKKQPNHRKGANILSIATFAFTIPTFRQGFQKDLHEHDITEHLQAHDSKRLGDKLEKAWKKELSLHQNPSLWRVIGKVFGLEFFFYGLVLVFLDLVVKVSQPIALSQLLKYYTQNEDTSITDNETYTAVIVGASFINVVVGHIWLLHLQHFGMKMRIAFCSIIYRKSLRLSRAVLGETTIGQIVNLLSNDVSRCDPFVLNAHSLWLCPLEIVTFACIVYYLVGLTSTIGILFMAMLIPFQMYMGKQASVFRLKTAVKTDKRVGLMNETISGIRAIKMYTWEMPFSKLVAIARRLEIRHIRGASYIKAFIISLAIFTTRFSLFLAILTYVLLGNSLTADYVFVVSSFYNILKYVMTLHFPLGIAQVAEFNVSISRIQAFLMHEEIQLTDKTIMHETKTSRATCVQIQDATAKWSSNSSENTLRAINFQAEFGQLVAIAGPVGSGKTSILHVMLNEIPLETGTVKVEGNISYASQEPWLFAGTLQQNILFGQPMMQERYDEVIRVCALNEDFNLFPYGDKTLVGERGVTLSGGQKSRVNLARAIYKEADIYLLDDPLSAVDTHVGKQLFNECILTFLQNKCTILVTHQLQYLQKVYRIYLVENGHILINGTYQELRKNRLDFRKEFDSDEIKKTLDETKIKKHNIPNESDHRDSPMEVKEQRSSGSVSGDVYFSYFKAGGSLSMGIGLLVLFLLTQLSASSTDYFLAYWLNLEQAENEKNRNVPYKNVKELTKETCIYIYSGITVFIIIITLFRSFLFFTYCMKASTRLHDNMFSNIVHAPMRFFDVNVSGRILNRFSKDMGSIDEVLPQITIDCVQLTLTVISVIIIVSLVNPWMLLVAGITLVLFYLLRLVYMKTSRSLKRLEGITRSPVFSHMSASIEGLTTVRAFGAEKILAREFDDHQDLHSSVSYWFLSCSRAFGFWLDLICVLYTAAVTFSFLIIKADQYGGNVGLAITQVMSLTGVFQWVMRQWTELEHQMMAVERVVEYTKVETEVSPTAKLPPPGWPEKGNIDFVSVSLKYSQMDLYVLKQLSFRVRSKEKLGVVGRTGAGKSSIINALFQLTKTEGTIIIDDFDVTQIPLRILRSKISIIPQEPVLFSGSLRKNLDPFDEYPDVALWKALEQVELKKVVADLPSGLHNLVCEGGSNFSVGQKQLLCLARAIIRRNNILVLDEATANIDPQTDALIQITLKRNFANCTVITIAHRLHTIMNSDKILVINAGKAVQFDHPHLLLKNKGGLFYGLVQETGVEMAESLMKIADNYQDKII